jgi:capsid protein
MNHPYEMVTKNWGGLSFAGGRLSLAECKIATEVSQQLVTEAWLAPIWRRMVFEAVATGACSLDPYTYSRARWWFHRHEWTPPSWPFALTPGEEVDADIKLVNNNLRSKTKVIAKYGGNRQDVFAERKAEREQERAFQIDPATAEAVPSVGRPPAAPPPQQTQQLQEAAQ